MRTFVLILLAGVLFSCSGKAPRNVIEYNGYAQGTTFHIIYDNGPSGNINPMVDTLFEVMDRSMSLYDSTSIICRGNKKIDSLIVDEHFKNVFEASKKVYEQTNGAFNPAIYPLVKFWGFGAEKYENADQVDSSQIQALLLHTDFRKTEIKQYGNQYYLVKHDPEIQLDFNAIAQGYTIDQLAVLMDSKGIQNYMIEVGGETRCKGLNKKNEPWRVGIDKPIEDPNTRELIAIANISDKSLATSGSYRKFYEKNGMKYSHTINPATGFPVSHTLISASVFMNSCTEADAYATAFMVMGTDAAKALILKRNDINVYLISGNYKGEWETYISEGLKEQLEVLKSDH